MKVLADTSIWAEHLRSGNAQMKLLLDKKAVCMHPLIIGELACGTLKDRQVFLEYLDLIPRSTIVPHAEILAFLGSQKLYGLGMNWIDVSLLASTLVSGVRLWTRDKALERAAEKLKVAFYS